MHWKIRGAGWTVYHGKLGGLGALYAMGNVCVLCVCCVCVCCVSVVCVVCVLCVCVLCVLCVCVVCVCCVCCVCCVKGGVKGGRECTNWRRCSDVIKEPISTDHRSIISFRSLPLNS